MVLLINSINGFNKIKELLVKNGYSVWYSKGILGNQELAFIQDNEVEYTELSFEFDLGITENRNEILGMVKEHHPNSTIFCEIM